MMATVGGAMTIISNRFKFQRMGKFSMMPELMQLRILSWSNAALAVTKLVPAETTQGKLKRICGDAVAFYNQRSLTEYVIAYTEATP